MSTTTTNLTLNKPAMIDKISTTISQLASNFDIIDSSLADKATKANLTAINITEKPYNAPNDGSDITSIINQAIIDTVASGQKLYFPEGNYGFAQIVLKENVKIIGAGRQKTILKHMGTGNGIVNNDASSIGYILLEDFSITTNANTLTLIDLPRVYMSVVNRVHISCPTVSPSTIGIHFHDGAVLTAYYNSCYDVSINGKMGIGFRFSDNGNSNRVVNCRTNQVTKPVVTENYTDHIVVTGCAFEVFDVGVTLGGIYSQVLENRFESDGAIGVLITSPYVTQQHTILGNMLYFTLGEYVRNDSGYDGNNIIHNLNEFKVSNANITGSITEGGQLLSAKYATAQSLTDVNGKLSPFKVPTNISVTSLVTNGSFTSGSTGWTNTLSTVVSTLNNELIFTATAQNGRIFRAITFPDGHLIYRSAQVKSTSNLVSLGQTFNILKSHSGGGQYERLSNVSNATTNKYISVFDGRTSGWDNISVKYIIAIDLTAAYGTGNEPSVDEMDSLLTANMLNGWFEGTTTAPIGGVSSTSGYVSYVNNKINTKTGTTSPTITPSFIGQVYVNTATGTGYMATGLTSADWKQTTP
jgi:hypothetical protein